MRMFSKEEIKELFAENNKAIAETRKAIAETRKAIAETNKAIDRLAERQEKTDKVIAELAESQKKTDEQIAKTAKQLAETDARLDRLGKRYGGLSNNVGKASEQLFFNILNDNPVLNGIHFNRPQRNWHNEVGKYQDEYDIVMKNDDLLIFILEVKFKPTQEDVEKLLTTKKQNFNILFPEYKDYDQHWGLAATIIDEELRKMALNNGLTVLQYKGELIESNPPTAPKERELIDA